MIPAMAKKMSNRIEFLNCSFNKNSKQKNEILYREQLKEFYSNQSVYSYEEVLKNSTGYFDGDDLAAKVFVDKYSLRNDNDEYLEKTPRDMHHRIAREFYRIEKKKFKNPLSYEEIFGYLDNYKWIVPQGSPMYGIGNPFQTVSLSNCYVLDPPLDSYAGICKTDEELIQISKRRGGVGIDLSNLRPEGASTHNAAKTSTGIISFMERFSNSIREVGQNGRRGALMESISVHHPEILKFTSIKNDLSKVTGANISIKLTDEFLEAVDKDTDYEIRWPVDSNSPKISKTMKARIVWNEIVKNAHAMAEPGLLFWDNIIRESPADCYSNFGYKTVCTNPCSEIPLSANDSCRLLLLNMFSFVTDPFTKKAKFDFDKFYRLSGIAQRLMDDLIDLEEECIRCIIDKVEKDPEPASIKTRELGLWNKVLVACLNGRRTGTGITANGDTLAALGIPYSSRKGINTTEKIYKTLKLGAYRGSVDMAKEIGAFPIWDSNLEKDNSFLNRIKDEDPDLFKDMQKYGRRNIALLTTAPTGSVSLQTQTSGGIEPEFSVSPYIRRKKGNPGDANFRADFVDQSGDSWMEFVVVKPKLKDWAKVVGKDIDWNSEDLRKKIEDPKWLNGDEEKPWDDSPWTGSCASDLDWKDRIRLQAAAQKHIDHAISSTLNLPEDATVEQVNDIYLTAWKLGCKGITIYRDGCRTGVMVKSKDESGSISKTNAPKRPKELPCAVYHISVKGEEHFVLVGLLGEDPYEIFAGRNGQIDKKIKEGTIIKEARGRYHAVFDDGTEVRNINDFIEDDQAALTRLISTCLRHGADINYVVHQLQKIKGEDMFSFARSIARAIKKHIPDETKMSGENCPHCLGENLIFREGCNCCLDCGYSKCM